MSDILFSQNLVNLIGYIDKLVEFTARQCLNSRTLLIDVVTLYTQMLQIKKIRYSKYELIDDHKCDMGFNN